MRFRLEVILTSIVGGTIEETLTISDKVIRKVSIEETVGDEMFTKASELILETNQELPELAGILMVNWLVLYIDDMLYNVYKHPLTYIEKDEKRNRYRYRCEPVQKIFYDDLAATAMVYNNTDSWHWNYELQNSWVDVIALPAEIGPGLTTRISFPLRTVLDGLTGKWLFDNGYFIDELSLDEINLPVSLLGEVPFIWRGESFEDGIDSDEDIVNGTFKESAGGDQFNMTWLDVFKILIFGWNAWIKVTPIIRWSAGDSAYVLGVNIDLIPRSARTPGTGLNLKWLERRIITEKYRIDGVKLTGKNFSYENGDIENGNVVEKNIDVADYLETLTDPTLELYLAEGHFTIAVGYSIDYPWFSSPSDHGDEFYGTMITAGNGISGRCKMIFEDGGVQLIRTLDEVRIDFQTAQLTTIRCGEDGVASVEGILLD